MTADVHNGDFADAPVLLTGFEPFGGEADNPSWDAVRRLHGERIGGRRVVAERLPVAFGASLQRLRECLDASRPALVLCVGQAGGRAQLSIERVAINVDDARIADNLGARPIDEPVIGDGPAAYFSTLPIKALRAALLDAGLPAEISQTAGTYVCNHVFYGLMHELHRRGDARVRGGFIHIPYSPAQAARHAGAPSLDADSVVRALRAMVETALATDVDRRLAGGAEH
ncbi:pyroglutamyl-peptidase I [Lysobacter sp. K5869]|uniref:pyroglutamyl-peptidase I n=1 Tax=Lysobacter sp. K5869 TaxID=2820808 RepID=UPI001C063A7D|nr:pyroglutamyl-peptidase I [Lysobacter sp. K5869]QWP74821.1 pyroglutamyl-peptidase I [Lysobacter sp. K5869]